MTDGTGCSSNQNIEPVVVPAEIHVVKMCFVRTSNWTLRLWLILYLNTNSICDDTTKEIHETTLFRLRLLLLLLICLHLVLIVIIKFYEFIPKNIIKFI